MALTNHVQALVEESREVIWTSERLHGKKPNLWTSKEILYCNFEHYTLMPLYEIGSDINQNNHIAAYET